MNPSQVQSPKSKVQGLLWRRGIVARQLALVDRQIARMARLAGIADVFFLCLVQPAQAGIGETPLPGRVGSAAAFLADAGLPDPHNYGAMVWVIGGLVALLGLGGMFMAAVNGVLAFRDRMRGNSPQRIEQPITVRAEERWVTVEQLTALREEVRSGNAAGERRRDDLEEKITKLDEAERVRIGTVHKRIDDLAESAGGTKAIVQLIAANLNIKVGGRHS